MNANTQPAVSMQTSSSEDRSGFTASKQQISARQAEFGEDDRYPGSFFRIPGVPMPGKTTWSLVK